MRWRVVHSPAVAIRSEPAHEASVIGTRRFGDYFRASSGFRTREGAERVRQLCLAEPLNTPGIAWMCGSHNVVCTDFVRRVTHTSIWNLAE